MSETLLAYFILGLTGIFVPPIFIYAPELDVSYGDCLFGWIAFVLIVAAVPSVVLSVVWALSVVLP